MIYTMEICGIRIQSSFSTSDFDEYTEVLEQQYNIIGFIDGHISKNKIYNPIWIIQEDKQIYLLIFCGGKDIFTKLCPEAYKRVLDFEKNINGNKKITWFSTEYICGITIEIGMLYIHQVITNYYRNGSGTGGLSVDHIDRYPYNNTLSNLRIATCEEQNQNRKGIIPGTKRNRQFKARELPEGIIQEDMPKYMNYNVNVWDKEKNKSREFFRIERHPLIYPKVWEGIKSMKVSIQDKLEQAKKVIQYLDNGILPVRIERDLPKHVYFTHIYEHPYLVYDNRNTKHTKQMRIKDESFDINNPEKREKQVYIFNHLIMKTYGEDESVLPEEYEYCGELIDEKELNEVCFQLPKYVCLFNEGGNTILAFHRIVNEKTLNKKMKLPNNYTLEELSTPLLEDIETIIPLLNKEIIKKYGSEYAIMEVTEEMVEKIMEEKQEDIINGFPIYVRIQSFENGDYIVFDKTINKIRLYTNMKLPNNYNKNNMLHAFNQKIIEVYGELHKLDLTNYPFQDTNKIIIHENMYIILNCKSPYMFIVENNKSIVHVLPERYDLQTEINTFYEKKYSYTPYNNKISEEYKLINDWKPKNISIMIKDGKLTLLYQKRSNSVNHCISISLPSTPYNIHLYLLEMNTRIVNKYGKEYNIFYLPE